MGIFSKFEDRVEDTVDSAASRLSKAPISPVQIAKKAEKQMRRETMVGAGKEYAPTLYTVLVNADDDERLFGYYPTLAGETETYLSAKAAEQGLMMDGNPLVRFIVDDGLRHGKFEVIAEVVASPIIEQLRDEEMERYGIAPQQGGADRQGARRGRGSAGGSRRGGYGYGGGDGYGNYAQGAARTGGASGRKPPLPYVPEEEIDRSIDYGEYTFNSEEFEDYGNSPYDGVANAAAGVSRGVGGAGVVGGIVGVGAAGAAGSADAAGIAGAAGSAYANSAPVGVPGTGAARAAQGGRVQGVPEVFGSQGAQGAPAEAASASVVQGNRVQGVPEVFGSQGAPAVVAGAGEARLAQGGRVQGVPEVFSPQDVPRAQQANTISFTPGNAAGQAMPNRNKVRARLIDRAYQRPYDLAGTRITIGRETGNDIKVQDMNASRHHAELAFNQQGLWVITDLNSMNGTLVNGVSVASQPLYPGDVITIGKTDFEFAIA